MERTVQEVTPGELCDAVDPCEVTLVLGAPSVGKSHHLRQIGPSVERLEETTAINADELVVVDDFVSAVLHSGDGDRENLNALFARPKGAVLVTRPRSLDWLCRRGHLASAAFLERVDSVLVVRIPPSDYGESFYEIRETCSRRNTFDPEYEEDSSLVERVTYPRYDFEDEPLQERIGTVEATVTPAACLSLSQYGSETVLVGPDIRTVVGECDGTVEPLGEAALDLVSSLHPDAEGVGPDPTAMAPAVATALVLVAGSLADDDTEWFEPLVRHRPLASAAEALEIAVDLPPGTIERFRVFASEPMRTRIGQRLAARPEAERVIAETSSAIETVRTDLRAVASTLDEVARGPDEYGSAPLVGAWHWEGPAALQTAATDREFQGSGDGPETEGRASGVDVDEVVDTLDGGLVILSGPKASGKRRLAATVARELMAWGKTVRLPDLHQPDHIRAGIDATPNALVVATYNGEPARIMSDAGVRALADWVDDGTCSGALLIRDDENREQFDTVATRAGCADIAAWRDRTEFELDNVEVAPDRTPRAVADDLLSAMDWPETRRPSRRTLEVDSVTGQSPLASIAGIPDSDLDAAFVGHVVADAIAVVAQTTQPTAATQWLSLVDDLVADVARCRGDVDSAITYRGSVYGTAMAATATEDPTTDEWIEAITGYATDLTNKTAAPHGYDSVGGDREPFVSAFGIALRTLAWPADGTGPNHAALACVDQVLHGIINAETIAKESGLNLRCRIYGEMTARIVDTADDPATADDALTPVAALVQQAAATNGDGFAAFVIGNSFAATLGALADTACSPENLSIWVDALGSRVRESTTFLQTQANREALLWHAYTGAIGYWGYEFDCTEERIEPWLVTVSADLCRTATSADLDDPVAFVADVYGRAVGRVVGYRDLDRAELLFGVCERLVDTVAASGLADDEWECRATLHAAALAAFARVEQDHPDSVTDGSYGTGLSPFSDSPRLADWIDLYDASVTRGAAAEAADQQRERYLIAVYRGALSTQVDGFDGELESAVPRRGAHEPPSTISPRREATWYQQLSGRIEAIAARADLVDDPVTFLSGVFGAAAANWATDGAAKDTQEWVGSLVTSFRDCRWAVDGPTKTDWFDAFAAVDGAILRAVLTRTDVGARTHERLVQAVFDRVQTAATAADHPPHPVNYVSTVFGTALALAVEADPGEVRFGVTSVVAAAEDQSFDWIGLERRALLERVYGEALAIVGRTRSTEPNTDEWLAVVTDRLDATATQELPDSPSAFVAGVFTRAYVHTVEDEADAWRRRLDSKLRAYATGAHVEDPAAFLEEVYADIVVAGTTTGQPAAEVEACVAAVYQSTEIASETAILRADDPAVGTFSRVANTLATENPRTQADHTYLFGQALRAVGGAELERAVFDAADGDSPLDDAGRDN
ncbi:hypothetical protein [Natrinema pallidum]|uniref:Uncharacterized protein n=1 Tax=Natrinema pallidum TaxID=69527 RepID=A0A4P9TJD4_9EURY|nr:hypothetical protein [Natrinema pallidum]QCW05069.1 hypothetical protein FGF80_17570 [Natrinema pallidum]